MDVSTQKFPQIFLYMSTTCCESFKSFGEVGKSFLLATFMTPKFRHLQKNGMSLTAPYSEVPSEILVFFTRVTPIYREHVQKKLECIWYLVWVLWRFKKKVLLACHTNMVAPNGLISERSLPSFLSRHTAWDLRFSVPDEKLWATDVHILYCKIIF